MIHINFYSGSDNLFTPHWDKTRYSEIDYDIQFNSDADIEWDCVVIYQNIRKPIQFRCKAGNVMYFSGEPPLMVPCPRVFTSQFDVIVLPHKKVKHPHKITSHGFLDWKIGYGYSEKDQKYNYNQLAELSPQKTKMISIVSSNLRMMPGHNRRMAIIEKLQQDYPEVVEIFGRGFNFINYKADALLPYRFHICMENSSICDYWTEKIADPILAQCVPIYAGCTNIDKYFGNKGYFTFDINDYSSLKSIIDYCVSSPDLVYESMRPSLQLLRKTLMEKQNIIPFVIEFVDSRLTSPPKEYLINPLENSLQYKTSLLTIRSKRFIYKQLFNLFKK